MRQQQQELTMQTYRPSTMHGGPSPMKSAAMTLRRRTRKLAHRDRYFDGLDDG